VSAERELLARLQQALTDADVDVDDLVEAAWDQAREDVQVTLRRLFAHDLLRRALDTIEAADADRARPITRSGADGSPPTASPVVEGSDRTDEGVSPGTTGTATYLFGMVPADAPPLAATELQLPGAGPVRHVEVGAVRAVVCDVDPGAFAQLRDPSADDLELLATAAYAHDALLAELAQLSAVLPLRLGTVVADDGTLRDVLARHEAALFAELDRLAGHAEWAVTVHLLDEPDATTTDDADEAGADSGREYLQRRREVLDVRGERWRAQEEVAAAVHGRLAVLAAETEVVGSRPLEDGSPPLLHAVYLLADQRWPDFERAVDEVREAHPRASIEVSGPWPPYHFTNVELGADDLATP
jgi:hypothetical protein